MNPTLDVLMKRKSIRSYADQKIGDSEKQAIFQAMMRAPTAGNMMLYSVIEVDDQDLKNRLAITCDDQPFIAKAPLVLLFLADYQRWYDYYCIAGVPEMCKEKELEMRRPAEGDLFLAICDTLIAAQTAVVAAEALGIASCYIGDILEEFEIHQELFGLPVYAVPITMVCFGYPAADETMRRLTPRFALETILHQNHYHRLTGAELEEMMRPRNDQMTAAGSRRDGMKNVGQFNYMRKFSAKFTIEMTRSVQKMMDTWNRGLGSD
jgi:nitroreductase